jgi:signal transduction histidine kinase
LGLFIARQIVVAHGGTILASSSGEETEFTVEIPRHLHRKAQEIEAGRDITAVAANG